VNRRLPHARVALLGGLAAIFLSCSAQAAEGSGWYAGGNLGLAIPDSQSLNSNTGPSFHNDWNAGFFGALSGGYTFPFGLRPELELSYTNVNNLRNITETSTVTTSSPTESVNGAATTSAVLANVWYDFSQTDGFFAAVHPYVGGGVGYADIHIDREHYNNINNVGSVSSGNITDGSGSALAYQFGAGAGSEIFPNLIFSVDFRYMFTGTFSLPNQASGGTFTTQYRVPTLSVGLRYRFGAPAVANFGPGT
jgi:outer membrane immunogenic protein